MSKGGTILKHHFYCTGCGNEGIPISRIDSSMRETGHLKKLYCLHCRKEINHAECIEGGKYDSSTFRLEFEFGNFDVDGNRVLPLKQWMEELSTDEDETNDSLTTEEWLQLFDADA
jgi:hypothetical protein